MRWLHPYPGAQVGTFRKQRAESAPYALRELRASVKHQDEVSEVLRAEIKNILGRATERTSMTDVNHAVLALCRRLYPPRRKTHTSTRPSSHPAVQQAVQTVWDAHQSMRTGPTAVGLRSAMQAWQRTAAFKQASRSLRQISRAARKEWYEVRIAEAEQAAQRHDLGAVYRTINLLAPKRRYEPVRIRGRQGELLAPHEEFSEIYQHFAKVFQ